MLKSLRIKNFKAIRDSKAIRLTPLTVFIGNNGSGKSSIIEALETYKTIIETNIEPELEEWFLYDLTALSSVLSTTAHPVTIRKPPSGGTNPKKTLTKLFEENTGKKYSDLIHADIIAKNISKFDKIAKKCPSFERFVQKIT